MPTCQESDRTTNALPLVELIDDFLSCDSNLRQSDTGEADEVIVALAKTVAELTSSQDGTIRQHLIEQLM
jgi:hypothetical protein